jgi:hypothetical protein
MFATKKTKHGDQMQNSGWYGIPLGWSASLSRAHGNKEQQEKHMRQQRSRQREQ